MERRLALITFLDGSGNYPDNSLPGLIPGIDNSLPGGTPGRPDNSLPPGAVQLPVFPFDPTVPDNSLPGGGQAPDNSLPRPGKKYIVKWLACKGLILVPDNSLPGSGNPPTAGQLPSGGGARPDNTLPQTPQPKS